MACKCDCGKPVRLDPRQFRDLLRAIRGQGGEVSGGRSFGSGERLQEPELVVVEDSVLLVETERLDARGY